MNNEQELKAHLQDNNKARTYEEKKLQKVMKEYAKTVTKEQDEHKKKEDEMIRNWNEEIAINKGGQQ